jgi:hypothetical protein
MSLPLPLPCLIAEPEIADAIWPVDAEPLPALIGAGAFASGPYLADWLHDLADAGWSDGPQWLEHWLDLCDGMAPPIPCGTEPLPAPAPALDCELLGADLPMMPPTAIL